MLEEIGTEEHTCVFCGEKRTITFLEDSGYDWMGHQRGTPRSETRDPGCDCALGKLEKQPVKIRPMCLNCKSYNSGYCTNKKKLQQIGGMFDVGDRAALLEPSTVCEAHQFNFEILSQIVVIE